MPVLLEHEDVDSFITEEFYHFNDAKTVQDRKYILYHLFSNVDKRIGYRVHRYIGSNQIILTKDYPTSGEMSPADIYDSDEDDFTPESFLKWLTKLIHEFIDRRKERTGE